MAAQYVTICHLVVIMERFTTSLGFPAQIGLISLEDDTTSGERIPFITPCTTRFTG